MVVNRIHARLDSLSQNTQHTPIRTLLTGILRSLFHVSGVIIEMKQETHHFVPPGALGAVTLFEQTANKGI